MVKTSMLFDDSMSIKFLNEKISNYEKEFGNSVISSVKINNLDYNANMTNNPNYGELTSVKFEKTLSMSTIDDMCFSMFSDICKMGLNISLLYSLLELSRTQNIKYSIVYINNKLSRVNLGYIKLDKQTKIDVMKTAYKYYGKEDVNYDDKNLITIFNRLASQLINNGFLFNAYAYDKKENHFKSVNEKDCDYYKINIASLASSSSFTYHMAAIVQEYIEIRNIENSDYNTIREISINNDGYDIFYIDEVIDKKKSPMNYSVIKKIIECTREKLVSDFVENNKKNEFYNKVENTLLKTGTTKIPLGYYFENNNSFNATILFFAIYAICDNKISVKYKSEELKELTSYINISKKTIATYMSSLIVNGVIRCKDDMLVVNDELFIMNNNYRALCFDYICNIMSRNKYVKMFSKINIENIKKSVRRRRISY